MVDRDNLERRTTDHGRVYTDFEDLYLPSVSTVLDQTPEPEGLKQWKKNFDGTGGKPHWEDILMYKANRGTLIHYRLLNGLLDGDMHGPEEASSESTLRDSGNWERYKEDLSFAVDAWQEIKQSRGITQDNVLDMECFVTNTDLGYAGQFDLLYIDKDGQVVLADLKTSKRIYPKHKKQLVAYDNALNLETDMLEIIRIHPDTQTWETSHSTEWLENREELYEQFAELRKSMDNVDEEFREIAKDGRKG